MTSSLLGAAFAHHVWATTRVIDACLGLSDEALGTSFVGTRGRSSTRSAISCSAMFSTCSR